AGGGGAGSRPIPARSTRRGRGAPRRRGRERLAAPPLAEPPRHAYELWAARRVFELLKSHYPGHLWAVDFSLARGGAAISIPILLGGNWVYFIRLADLTPAMVVRAGGEILERYRLPRGRFELGSFLGARARHSIMAGNSRKVPS